MSNLTTAHLRHLLAQSTPGPWEYEGPQFQVITTLDQDGLEQSVISLDRYTEKETCNRAADMNLAAHAPELAQEVIRLRSQLTAMKRPWFAIAIDPNRLETEQTLATYVLEHIDHILGDHDE